MPPTICCLTEGLTERTRQRVEEAGRKVGAEIFFNERLAEEAPPHLVLSVLPVGQRRVPQDLMENLSHGFPECRVMLLCQEPLCRSLISLQNGRLLLVGLPLTAGRIEAGLKCGLNRGEHSEEAAGLAPVQGEAEGLWALDDLQPSLAGHVRQYRGSTWWAAALCWQPPESWETAPERILAARIREERFTALMSLNDEPLSEELAARVLEGPPGHGSDPKLRTVLNDSQAAVWLDLKSGSWAVYGLAPAVSVYLFSQLRFPPCTELGPRLRAEEGGWMSWPYAPGDTLLLATGLTQEHFAAARELHGEAAPRGLALLRLLEEQWRARGCQGVGLAVEVWE